MTESSAEFDDDHIEINARQPEEIAARMAILLAVAKRAFIDLDPEAVDDPETLGATGERFDILAWLDEHRMMSAATQLERSLLESELGSVDHGDIYWATWSVEGLAALTSAVLALELSTWGPLPCDAQAVLSTVESSLENWPAGSSITVPDDELVAKLRETAELWYWRNEFESERRHASPAERIELAEVIREVAEEACAAGLLPRVVDGDFEFNGKPYRTIGDRLMRNGEPILEQRLIALNWLAGFGDSWDDVPLDV